MKKLLIISLLATGALNVQGQESPAAQNRRPIGLKTYAEYAYNYSSGHYGGLAAIGTFPVNEYFDLRAGVNAATENTYTLDGRAIVKFPMKKGRLTLENRILYQAVVRNRTHHLCTGLSLSYGMDHLKVSLGGYSRFYRPMGKDGHSTDTDCITEPFNLMWSIEGLLKKDSHKWNLGLRAGNFNDFRIERYNQLTFTVTVSFKPARNINVFTEAFCEPAGIFHRAANFYEAGIRLGINLKI